MPAALAGVAEYTRAARGIRECREYGLPGPVQGLDDGAGLRRGHGGGLDGRACLGRGGCLVV